MRCPCSTGEMDRLLAIMPLYRLFLLLHASPWPSVKTYIIQDVVHVLYLWQVFLYPIDSQVRLSSSSLALLYIHVFL